MDCAERDRAERANSNPRSLHQIANRPALNRKLEIAAGARMTDAKCSTLPLGLQRNPIDTSTLSALGPRRFFAEKYRECGKNDTGDINTRRSRFRGRFAKQLFVESKNHFFKGNRNRIFSRLMKSLFKLHREFAREVSNSFFDRFCSEEDLRGYFSRIEARCGLPFGAPKYPASVSIFHAYIFPFYRSARYPLHRGTTRRAYLRFP